jgi:branched-chain amino acid aminotransferase
MSTTATYPIRIQKTTESSLKSLDFSKLSFGKDFSDHMFVADFKNGKWEDSRVVPYTTLSIRPAAAVLHYGQAIFEGMKAYKNDKGEIHLFRPLENFKRMNRSAERMCMQTIPEEVFMGGLNELVKLDKDFVPTSEGSSLYIRPFLIATDEYIGVHPSDDYKFIIITSPSGAYYSEPVKVLVETKYTRAAEGGVGFAKVAGNYGGSLLPAKLAAQKGYQQLFWTDGRSHRFLEESGTMNLMVIIDDILITPSLGDTILPGVTRNSILTIAREWGIKVQERKISIDEVIEAHQKGTLQDAFGAGTAATITHISHIGFEGKDYELPPIGTRTLSNRLKKELHDIHKGVVEDTRGWMYKIC